MDYAKPSEYMKNNIVDLANDPIFCVGLKGDVLYANNAFVQVTGYTREEILNRPYSCFTSLTGSQFQQLRQAILFNEAIEPTYLFVLGKDNRQVSAQAQFSPLKDGNGQMLGLSIILRQVSTYERLTSRAEDLLETAPDAMIIVNNQGQIVLANAQTEVLFGYNRSELLGREIEVLIPDEFLKNHKKYRDSYIGTPKTRAMGQGQELLGKKKDGSTFPVEISLSPLQVDGGLTFISAAIRDIAYRQRAENKFKELLDSAPDAMVIVNESGLIELINTQAENVFGYSKSELQGQAIEVLIPARFAKKHPKHRSTFFTNPKLRPMGANLELLGLRKNGEEFPVEISLSPLETEEGMLVSAAIRDITERKKYDKALQAFNAQLQNKNKELEQFAYIASHDLQEPLRTIKGFSNLLESEFGNSLDGTAKKGLRFISEATDRMELLIKGLLDYSRIGQNRNTTSVDCNKVLDDVKKDLSSLIQQTETILKSDQLPDVEGNETELRLLLQNLITNGIKFRKEEGSPKIVISASEKENNWTFSVQDNGIGIEAEYKERIFIIFQRLHERQKYEGTGIGLAHCQKIVELHGGKIWVESTLGVGSTFYFSIPKAEMTNKWN